MHNVNINESGGGGGGGAAGGEGRGGRGRGRLFYGAATTGVALAVGVCAGLAYAVWKMYQSGKKLEELNRTVQYHQGYIEQDQQEKLMEVMNLLVERQDVFCSPFKSYWYRKELEAKILWKITALENMIPNMSNTVKKIYTEDDHCGSTMTYIVTRDKTNNGKLMWEEMDKWKEIWKNRGKS